MKLRKLIATLLIAVTVIGIGTAALTSAKAENEFFFSGNIPVHRGTMVITEDEETEDEHAATPFGDVSQAIKQNDILKPMKDMGHDFIDDLDMGDKEKELVKKITDAVIGTTIGPEVAIPGMGALSRITEAVDEMQTASNCKNADERAELMQDAAGLLIESAITLVPGGTFILQGEKVLEAVGDYIGIDEIIDTLTDPDAWIETGKTVWETITDGDAWVQAGNDILDGLCSAGSTIVDGLSAAGNWFIGLFD